MRTGLKAFGIVAVIVVALAVAGTTGFVAARMIERGGSSAASTGPESPQALGGSQSVPYTGVATPGARSGVSAEDESFARAPAKPEAKSDSGATSPTPGRLVIMNAAMNLRVKSVQSAVDAIRAIAAGSGSLIADLHVSAGESQSPSPIAADAAGTGASASRTPSIAGVTLRVPADRLTEVESQVARTGTVLAQSASENDVTQQHVDLAARLKNLQAEEAQLRTFYRKARNVDDLLAVQQQLSDVQGQIESMQAQLDYLSRQAALATLTIQLSEPGPIVRPAGTSWGFSAAVTRGVQAAAALVRAGLTAAIALSPLVLIGLLLWALSRILRRGRPSRPALAGGEAPGHESAP